MTLVFHIVATALLAFIAAIWETKGWANIVLKAVFVLSAVLGAVVTAADLLARGWLA